MLSEVESLDQYMQAYGQLLGMQVKKRVKPLHTPGSDPVVDIKTLRKPFPAQEHLISAAVKLLETGEKSVIICGEMGVGKAQPLTCRVLTPTGWRLMGDLKVGDSVIDPDGGVGSVTGVFPQGSKPVFRVSMSDGSSTRCCDEHLWAVRSPLQKNRGKPFSVKSLAEIRKNLTLHGKNSSGKNNTRWYIPVAAPVEFSGHGGELDPYLLGVLLGDGCITGSTTVTFTTPQTDVVDECAKRLPEGMEIRTTGISHRIVRKVKLKATPQIEVMLSELGLLGTRSETKFIPHQYLIAKPHIRLQVLQGLLDTDGHTDGRNGHIEYSTSSPSLYAGVEFLVRSLGGTHSVSVKEPSYQYRGEKLVGLPSYRMIIKLPAQIRPFLAGKKAAAYSPHTKYGPCRGIVSVEPDGSEECQCISVSTKNSLYVTDDFIVTHNTFCMSSIAHAHAKGKPYRGLIFGPPHLVPKWGREIYQTIPECRVHLIDRWSDLVALQDRKEPTEPEWWVVSENTAKLGPAWEPVFAQRTVCDGKRNAGYIFCPVCNRKLEKERKETGILEPLEPKDLQKSRLNCDYCDTELWTWTSKLRRWPAAAFIRKKLKGVFDYLVLDELQNEKSENSARANAAGTLVSAVKHVIAGTGTLIGGQADHLRTLMIRLTPHNVVGSGFGWDDYMPFSERYGRIERRVTRGKEKGGGSGDNRCSRGSGTKTTKIVRPGVMPTLFGDMLIKNTVFLSLSEVSDELPPLVETLHPIQMDEELAKEYEELERVLRNAVKMMAAKGDKRLLGAMLQALMCYPDKPFDWNTIGYWEGDGDGDQTFIPIYEPVNLDPTTIRAKERAIVEDCVREKAEGRQVWVFTTMSDKRDVCERLRDQMVKAGLKATVLRASVETRKREEWIATHGATNDVIISHPQLVETGLDLFDKGGGHNFSTISWYLPTYNAFTLRQASRRAWRIGQRLACRVKYFFYANTMQEQAMTLMGQKMSACQAIEGKFSSEGLIAMAGEEGSIEMAMAKALVQKIDPNATRAWSTIAATAAPKVATQGEPRRKPIVHETKRGQPLLNFTTVKQLSLFG